MNQLPNDIADVRHVFSCRFDALARQHQVEAKGLLVLPEQRAGELQSRQTSEVSCEQPKSAATSTPGSVHIAPVHTLFIPGLLGDSVRNIVAPMMCARERLASLGYEIEVAWVNGRAGCAHNASLLYERIMRAADEQGAAVNVIAYSKGCSDCLHMLGQYPESHQAVRSLVSLVGVVHGTPLANDPPWLLRKALQYLPVPGVPFGDGRAIVDLSCKVRRQWLADHALPSGIRYASVAAIPPRARVSRVLRRSYDKLALINPENDSQVIDVDTLLPGSELLAVVNADHWAIALPVKERLPWLARWLIDKNDFPRSILLQCIIDHLAEHKAC